MERTKYLIVVAGGRGERMGGGEPKQFRLLGGRPVLQISIEKFIEAVPDINVVTVLPSDSLAVWKDCCTRHSFFCPQTVATGGFTRFHSVKAGLDRVPDGAIVAVHDGVRPLLSADLISRMFGMAVENPAVIPVVPCTDTLKVLEKRVSEDGEVAFEPVPGAVADRSSLFAAQTPQVFHSEVLRQAYSQAFDTAFTDDASVVERAGFPLKYVEGERLNIKITTPDDFLLAGAVLGL